MTEGLMIEFLDSYGESIGWGETNAKGEAVWHAPNDGVTYEIAALRMEGDRFAVRVQGGPVHVRGGDLVVPQLPFIDTLPPWDAS